MRGKGPRIRWEGRREHEIKEEHERRREELINEGAIDEKGEKEMTGVIMTAARDAFG